MEADFRTQAAVRSEKAARAENATLKLACETNNRLLNERTEQLNKLDATAAHWLQKAHEYQAETQRTFEFAKANDSLMTVARAFLASYEENEEDEWNREWRELAERFRVAIAMGCVTPNG